MKPLIDLSQAAGKTVEKTLWSGSYMAIHFTDGTASLLYVENQDYEAWCPAIVEVGASGLKPDDESLALDICTQEENREYNERRDAERRQRTLQNELAEYQRLKKQFEAAGGMPEPF